MKYSSRRTVKNRRNVHKKIVGGNPKLREKSIGNSAIELDNVNLSVLQEAKEHLDNYLKTIKPQVRDQTDLIIESVANKLDMSIHYIESAREQLQSLLSR